MIDVYMNCPTFENELYVKKGRKGRCEGLIKSIF